MLSSSYQTANSVIYHVCQGKKGKAESALHGIQTTLKCSGMDHTAFNLQRTPCQPLPRKRSPDGASIECGGSPLLIYRPREDERLTWPGWLTYSGRLTHISGHPSAIQVERRTAKERWPETDDLPLSHADQPIGYFGHYLFAELTVNGFCDLQIFIGLAVTPVSSIST